ncbi:hypothetical protein BBJ29_004708 [Phytophthora kernoviae]|uniref:Probable pectate lyase F n=1 Tax=Phytophthora kernoviae TaxID=325452 RepID=A0A3F2RRP0_9STRA|nr:hypothetical protein BBP00_00004766 [Phytophthora kernoviae]RLN68568.1 hypothetical protein BBJ29_004708 [Phytophthora kernoviae]
MSIVTETSAGSLDSLISTMGTSPDTSDTSNNVVQSLKEKGSTTAPFNGGMKTYKRSNVAYKSGAILTRQNAVFVVKAGGTLRNVIIAGGGGVFCETHNCALVNVWFLNSVQGSLIVNSGAGVTTLTGGGAKNVAHRVVYSQGSGTVVVSGGFYMETSGRLFESCGTCGPVKRGVIVDGVVSVDPTAELVRVNQNYNDRATIAKATITTQTTIFDVCARYKGGPTPTKIGAGPNPPVCSYTDASVKINSIDRIVPAV